MSRAGVFEVVVSAADFESLSLRSPVSRRLKLGSIWHCPRTLQLFGATILSFQTITVTNQLGNILSGSDVLHRCLVRSSDRMLCSLSSDQAARAHIKYTGATRRRPFFTSMDFRISSAQSKNTSDCNKMSSLGHAPRPYSTSPNTLPTTTRIGNWEHFMTAKQQRGTGRTFFNGSRDETDSSSRQSRHDTERRIGSSTNTNATPANNTHLGAEVSCVTTTGNASLLPTVIVNALNSRVKRSSQFSRDHSTLASVQPASPPRISSSVSQVRTSCDGFRGKY